PIISKYGSKNQQLARNGALVRLFIAPAAVHRRVPRPPCAGESLDRQIGSRLFHSERRRRSRVSAASKRRCPDSQVVTGRTRTAGARGRARAISPGSVTAHTRCPCRSARETARQRRA